MRLTEYQRVEISCRQKAHWLFSPTLNARGKNSIGIIFAIVWPETRIFGPTRVSLVSFDNYWTHQKVVLAMSSIDIVTPALKSPSFLTLSGRYSISAQHATLRLCILAIGRVQSLTSYVVQMSSLSIKVKSLSLNARGTRL